MDIVSTILAKTYFGNRLDDYLLFIGILLLGIILVKLIQTKLLKVLKRWSLKTSMTIDDFFVEALEKIFLPFSYCGLLYFGLKILTVNEIVRKAVNVSAVTVLTFFGALAATMFIRYAFNIYWIKRGKDAAFEKSLAGILKVIKVLVWSFAVMFFLDNMGFKISTVIAGLGIGGIAVGLAAQAVLKDMFSYFSIVMDHPFEVGDFIIVDDYLGAVEHIGIKTTRVRSLGGEQLIFSNTDLTDSRVRNYKRMEKRRVVFRVGVTYDTPLDKLKIIPKKIEETVKSVKDTVFDRAHFFSYGDFSLVFEVAYYVMGGDYNKYMDIQQEINFSVKEKFEEIDVEFAFPTQTLYVNKAAG
ncbi:MAG: mechanosensitive ion channel family protein [Candidatus Omnitrophota bacterium]